MSGDVDFVMVFLTLAGKTQCVVDKEGVLAGREDDSVREFDLVMCDVPEFVAVQSEEALVNIDFEAGVLAEGEID